MDKSILPPSLLAAIRPSPEELDGSKGCVVDDNEWEPSSSSADFIVAGLVVSSDGVQPKKTQDSHVRPIMGSVDRFHSPHLEKPTYLPADAPAFIIGIYRGDEQQDDVSLVGFVKEMEYLAHQDDGDSSLEVCANIFAYVADDKERRILTGCIAHSGLCSCPRCLVVGTKEISAWQKEKYQFAEKGRKPICNGTYFPDLDAPPRVNEDWPKYIKQKVHRTEV